jgi:hypothetical protein
VGSLGTNEACHRLYSKARIRLSDTHSAPHARRWEGCASDPFGLRTKHEGPRNDTYRACGWPTALCSDAGLMQLGTMRGTVVGSAARPSYVCSSVLAMRSGSEAGCTPGKPALTPGLRNKCPPIGPHCGGPRGGPAVRRLLDVSSIAVRPLHASKNVPRERHVLKGRRARLWQQFEPPGPLMTSRLSARDFLVGKATLPTSLANTR